MKKFFSMDDTFNIFKLIGIIIIISNFFIKEPMLIMIGLLIAWIPDINKGIINYKNTAKINSTLVVNGIILICLIIMLTLKLLKI